MQINPYLHFDGDCAEAMRFYAELLGGRSREEESALFDRALPMRVYGPSFFRLELEDAILVTCLSHAREGYRIPLLSLVGGLALVGFAGAIAILLWDPGSGASLSHNPGKLELAALVYVVAFAVYFIARAVRRSQGIDIELAHVELPPE